MYHYMNEYYPAFTEVGPYLNYSIESGVPRPGSRACRWPTRPTLLSSPLRVCGLWAGLRVLSGSFGALGFFKEFKKKPLAASCEHPHQVTLDRLIEPPRLLRVSEVFKFGGFLGVSRVRVGYTAGV